MAKEIAKPEINMRENSPVESASLKLRAVQPLFQSTPALYTPMIHLEVFNILAEVWHKLACDGFVCESRCKRPV